MQILEGKVGFITGGASGIGLGIAKAFTKYGMKVIIVDLRQYALDEAMIYFHNNNLPAYTIRLDVTDRVAYTKAVDEAEAKFGKIHVLVNNAGVGGPIRGLTFNDWDYSMGINIGGVINGLVTVLPRILRHGEGGHIISTSSTNGIAASGFSLPYCTSKFAVTGMMEALATELQTTNVGASVLIPGPIATNLGNTSLENRPAYLRNSEDNQLSVNPQIRKNAQSQQKGTDTNVQMDPLEVGERVVRAIKNNDLYIITHPEFKAGFNARHQAILRACPNEPIIEKRLEVFKSFGTVYYNDIYDKQRQVGPPDW